MRKEIVGGAARFALLFLLLTVLLVLTGSAWILAGIGLMFLLPLTSWGANAYVRKHLLGEIILPTTTAKNAAVNCTVRIHNDALLPVARYFCTVEIVNDLTCETETVTLAGGVGAKQSSTHSFLLQSRYCGRLYVALKSVTLMDYFGFLPRKANIKAAARITVLPDLFPMDADMTARPSYASDGAADRRGEDRSEVFQLREYQPGDDVRQIHWKLSAKLEELVLKEASLPESRSLLVFWDKRAKGTPAQMDALAEVVASVSSGLLESGVLFALSWTERDELQMQDIVDETILLQTIPALVKNTGSPDCRIPNMESYSRVLYFGAQPEESLSGDDRVHFVLCTEAEYPEATVFTPRNYQEKLQRLEV